MAISVTKSVTSVNGTTRNVAFSAASAGDLLIAIVFGDGTGTYTWAGSPSATEIADVAVGSVARLAVAYRIATGGETNIPATCSVSERSAHIGIRVPAAEWHGTTPPEIALAASVSSNSPNPPALNPAGWDTEATIWVAGYCTDSGGVSSYPSGYTDNQTVQAAADVSSAAYGAIATRVASVASEDPGNFVISTADDNVGFTIAIRPPVAGTPLVGSSGGSGGASAALTTAIKLAAASAGIATAASVLTTAIRLASLAPGTSGAAAVLTTAIRLAAASAGAAGAAGALATQIRLAALGAGGSGASAALTTSISLVASSAGIAVAVGELTNAPALLIGSSAGSSGAQGALTTAIRLAAASAGQAAASGDLSTEIRLRAQADGQGLAAAALTTAIALAGSAPGTSDASARFLAESSLAGSAAGGSGAAGVLTTAIALRGGAAGLSTAQGILATAIRLVGAAPAGSFSQGDLTTIIRLLGEALAGSGGAGSLTTAVALRGTSAGQGDALADLATSILMRGSAAGLSTAAAAFVVQTAAVVLAAQAIAVFGGDLDQAHGYLLKRAVDWKVGRTANARGVPGRVRRARAKLHAEAALSVEPGCDCDAMAELRHVFHLG